MKIAIHDFSGRLTAYSWQAGYSFNQPCYWRFTVVLLPCYRHCSEKCISTNSPRDQSDIESDNERETEKVCDEVILGLFTGRKKRIYLIKNKKKTLLCTIFLSKYLTFQRRYLRLIDRCGLYLYAFFLFILKWVGAAYIQVPEFMVNEMWQSTFGNRMSNEASAPPRRQKIAADEDAPVWLAPFCLRAIILPPSYVKV